MGEMGFELAPGFPLWLVFFISALLASLGVYQFLVLKRKLGVARASCLSSLRFLCYAVVVLFFLTPTFVNRRVLHLPARIAVMIDRSQSMGLAEGGVSRLEAVKRFLGPQEGPLMTKWGKRHQIQLYEFDETARPLAPQELMKVKPQGRTTRLVESLAQVMQGPREERPQAVILFSDGITHEQQPVADYRLPSPLFAVGAGTGPFRDNWIKEVKAPEFGFRDTPVRIDVTVVSEGYPGRELPIYLYRGRSVLATKTVRVSGDRLEQDVTFTFIPKELGAYHLSVETPLARDEALRQNNQKRISLEVLREKIRALTLTGSPAWNYRFLRMALKRDPMMDLISFVFLRTPTDDAAVPENQLSLIPFPIDTLFDEELKNFDLLIFDDFTYRPYFNSTYLEKVRDFVQEGGGFAMIGGGRSFDDGGYASTPIAEILPVELTGHPTYRTRVDLKAAWTEAGKRHSITAFLGGDQIKRLPSIKSFNHVDQVVGGETLLAISQGGKDQNLPLLVVEKAGKGRVAALMTDDLWKWNFKAVGEGGSNLPHLKLFGRLMRWLVKEPALEQVQIVAVSKPTRPQDRVEVRVRALKDDYAPATAATLEATVQGPAGNSLKPEVGAVGNGEFVIRFFPDDGGSFVVRAEAKASGKSLGTVEKGLLIRLEEPEAEDGKPREDFLKRLSEKSGGAFLPLSELTPQAFDRFLEKIDKSVSPRLLEEKETRLWSTLPALLGLLLLLCTEWVLRRRWGML